MTDKLLTNIPRDAKGRFAYVCDACNGQGLQSAQAYCRTCDGTGVLTRSQRIELEREDMGWPSVTFVPAPLQLEPELYNFE